MRENNKLLQSFMPKHEKEWDARLFIDTAIKGNVEYQTQVLARALSGRYDIKIVHAKDERFTQTRHVLSDEGDYFKVTESFKLQAKVSSYVFYGNNMTELWLKIIGFWAVQEGVFPCGGAAFPSEKAIVTFKQD